MPLEDFNLRKSTQAEYNDFVDRELYATLVYDLSRDPIEAIQIMAIWIWLGRLARRSPDLTRTILTLPSQLIDKVGDEALFCWTCIDNVCLLFSSSVTDFPLTNILLMKDMPVEFIKKYRDFSIFGINEVIGVCASRLKDIWDGAIARNAHVEQHGRNPIQTVCGQDNTYSFQLSSVKPRKRLCPTPAHGKAEIQRDERTLFVTFSRGHPVAEWEVREFFKRLFGECIESFYMQEVAIGEHALFAKIVLHRSCYIHAVLSGGTKAKFTINGKHVWMRKFIPKHR